ncbi:PucR family transcriptional regulator [Sporosarcina gallistercoris]|uniref:PucR family transcriptional regulator ligand-binding domain-containing protein n=1 Tax=Sporosarcina gallistercoris TaxID=2762245 RepID=A0ABR8PKA9_9BACL|nr:PucR family transcriptional regulator [Sporosarcina gallistercoris]MBD7908599.1 PucR family transcriptional regulator ligand-binding domain-containing protein [Sporosarcina gallistercoris]
MLKVKDLLTIKAIDGLQVVAGHAGLDNQISLVNIMENPDGFDWLSPNELLLSTGYIFKDNVELQNRIIQELSEINCSGLIVKTKRYFDKLPDNMIEKANEFGLPLLELPYSYTLSNVISIINEKASGRYDLLNRKTLDIHNLFFKTSLEGGGLSLIASTLAEAIENPILIVDQDWRYLTSAEAGGNPVPMADYLFLSKSAPLFDESFIRQIPKNFSTMKRSIKRSFTTDETSIVCRILPIAVSNNVYGYIIVWQTMRDLLEFDYIVLEQASTIMALERIKAKEIEEVKLEIRQDFFDDLLAGKIKSETTLQTLCDLHGMNAQYRYYCMVINIKPSEVEQYEDMIIWKYKMEKIAKKCVDVVNSQSYKAKGEITCFFRSNRIIVLIGQKEDSPADSIATIKAFAHGLHHSLSEKIKERCMIGIGRQVKGISSLHKSFSEANEMIRLTQQLNEKSDVAHFEDYAVYHLLDSNIKEQALEDFFEKCLGPLLAHDQENGTAYIETFEYYFANNANVTETSKAMFIHRNTLIYRIERIQEILGLDIKHSEDVLRIQIALKIFRILDKRL